jgi:hypothetical protein
LILPVLAAGMLPSCGGSTDVRPEENPRGDILKISYYRVNPEPKTKRPEPTYRVLMSRSWQDQVGENPREPLPKAAPNQVYKGFEEDSVVRRYVEKLRSLGLDQLRPQNPDDVNPQALYAAAMNPSNPKPPRVLTVGTDKSAKCYFSTDQGEGSQSDIFIKCEMYVVGIMAGHTIKVQIVTDPREKQ